MRAVLISYVPSTPHTPMNANHLPLKYPAQKQFLKVICILKKNKPCSKQSFLVVFTSAIALNTTLFLIQFTYIQYTK